MHLNFVIVLKKKPSINLSIINALLINSRFFRTNLLLRVNESTNKQNTNY